MDSGTPAGLGLGPDPAMVPFNHLATDRKADSGARILVPMQALEDAEDFFSVPAVEPDPVIPDCKVPLDILLHRGDGNGGALRSAILHCIRDQVLKHLHHLCPMKM